MTKSILAALAATVPLTFTGCLKDTQSKGPPQSYQATQSYVSTSRLPRLIAVNGLVESPYAPGKEVDVQGYRPGSIVRDPYTGQLFIVSGQRHKAYSRPVVFRPAPVDPVATENSRLYQLQQQLQQQQEQAREAQKQQQYQQKRAQEERDEENRLNQAQIESQLSNLADQQRRQQQENENPRPVIDPNTGQVIGIVPGGQ
jgi:hypothetical protein